MVLCINEPSVIFTILTSWEETPYTENPLKAQKSRGKKIYVNIIKTPFSEQSQPYEKSIYNIVNAVESSFFLLGQKIRV